MQRVIRQWGDLMEVTGGALASDKTYWYLVEFVWKRGKWVAADAPLEFDLIAKTEDNNFVSLNRLSCSTVSEMLGIWMAPNGCKTKIIQEMRTSTVEWGAKIRKGRPPRRRLGRHCILPLRQNLNTHWQPVPLRKGSVPRLWHLQSEQLSQNQGYHVQ